MKLFAVPNSFNLLAGIAAVALIGTGIAAMATVFGILPSRQSPSARDRVSSPPEAAMRSGGLASGVRGDAGDTATGVLAGNHAGSRFLPGLARGCETCGVIQKVREVPLAGHGSGEGAYDAVGGAPVGSQAARSHSRAALGVLGAVGGAFPGNAAERNLRARPRYHVSVLMDDGTKRTMFFSAPPAFAVGEAVRIVDGTLASAHG